MTTSDLSLIDDFLPGTDLSDVSFGDVEVEAGCSATLTLRDLPVGDAPVWLDIPDEVAGHFAVVDVKVGRDSQLSSTGAVPAALFARSAPLDGFLLDAFRAGNPSLSLSVTNLSSESRVFRCRPIFSCEDSRLARYRRARLVGLGMLRVAPLGCSTVTVQPSRPLSPDRLFVPRALLEKVDVERLEVSGWIDGVGACELVDSVWSKYLRRDNMEKDGLFYLSKFRSVDPRECLVVRFRNRTDAEVVVTGAILGGEPIP